MHFRGGGKSLVLPVSRGEVNKLCNALQGDDPFHTIQTQANQMVTFRVAAIADLHIVEDNTGGYGPECEKGTYDQFDFIDLEYNDGLAGDVLEGDDRPEGEPHCHRAHRESHTEARSR